MKKISAMCALLYLITFFFLVTYSALRPIEDEIGTSRHVLTLPNIDLSKSATISWDISATNWQYTQGDAELSLILNQSTSIPANLRDGSKLRLKISASATGTLSGGVTNNRLIQDWYYTTDEPFTNSPRLGESGNAEMHEYLLAGINVRPFERLIIKVEVLSPYPELQSAMPRLQLAPAHDYAMDEHIPAIRFIAWGACGVAICAAFFLFLQAWRKTSSDAAQTQP